MKTECQKDSWIEQEKMIERKAYDEGFLMGELVGRKMEERESKKKYDKVIGAYYMVGMGVGGIISVIIEKVFS